MLKHQFSWVTDLELTAGSVEKVMRGGRARWKIENETFNTLKNQGYQLEHNFGHGQQHLSVVFAMLMLLAVLGGSGAAVELSGVSGSVDEEQEQTAVVGCGETPVSWLQVWTACWSCWRRWCVGSSKGRLCCRMAHSPQSSRGVASEVRESTRTEWTLGCEPRIRIGVRLRGRSKWLSRPLRCQNPPCTLSQVETAGFQGHRWELLRLKDMMTARCNDLDYINFLLGTPRVFSATEAARVQPDHPLAPAHDAFTRLLHRLEPDPITLFTEVRPLIQLQAGALIIDDSTLDKFYCTEIELVCQHWSGKHHRVVQGIHLISLVWTDGDRIYPCDYRIANKSGDEKSKNDHFQDMIETAHTRGFRPKYVLFDSWYGSLANLKKVHGLKWHFLTGLKSNRLVNPDKKGNRAVSECEISDKGTIVHLKGFGMVKVFRIVAPDGDTRHWVTNNLEMEELQRLVWAERLWSIEEYHRGLKQFCGVEKSQVRKARGQRNHIGMAIRALVRLEYNRFTTGMSWFEAKMQIIRQAVREFIAHPLYSLPPTA